MRSSKNKTDYLVILIILFLGLTSLIVLPDSSSGSDDLCAPPPSGLVAWYPGDGNANDIVGGNNGTLQNGAAFAPGKVGQAFSLDGSGAIVTTDSPNLLPGTGSFTLDAWVRTTSTAAQMVMSKYECGDGCIQGVANSAYWFFLSAGKVQVFL